MEPIHLSILNEETVDDVAPLVCEFRQELERLRPIGQETNLQAAAAELHAYLEKQYPVYVIWFEEHPVGYAVARVDDDTGWRESIYVVPAMRRIGLATELFRTVEELAVVCGGDTIYNYVHPNNHPMIAFLKRHGYDVLNLIEVRKAYKDENLADTVQVGEHPFRY